MLLLRLTRPFSSFFTSATSPNRHRHATKPSPSGGGPPVPMSATHAVDPYRSAAAAMRAKTPPVRSASAQSSYRDREPPKRQDSLGRAAVHAAQSLMERMGARASPTLFRSPQRANSKEHDSDREESDDDDEEGSSGDEALKGHGRESSAQQREQQAIWAEQRRNNGSFSSHRYTPTSAGPTRRPSRVAHSPRPIEEHPHGGVSVGEGRKTPAKYRPDSRAMAERVAARGGSGHESSAHHWTVPLPPSLSSGSVPESPFGRHGMRMGGGAGSGSLAAHSSIHMDDMMATPRAEAPSSSGAAGAGSDTASPLFIPQARRGAINLKKTDGRSRKRSKRQRQAQLRRRRRAKGRTPRRPFFETLTTFISSLAWHAIHPIHTLRVLSAHLSTTLRDIDVAFRCPHTGHRVWRPDWLGAYVPLLIWLVVSVSSTIIVLLFHTQVFRGLDRLSSTLQGLGATGRMILGGLIFLTTFPPLPLYSTLIILCGFSFGLWQGFLISYVAALSGAVVVYLLSKTFLRSWMTGLLAKSGGLKKVVRAIEKRPSLLFLIRLAPYPYNLMNTLLASSPTLTFGTYFWCTALALPKLLVHCGLGTSIKNFAAYHGADATTAGAATNGTATAGQHATTSSSSDTATAERVKKFAGIIGVLLCIGIFLYLFSVARRAVDEELDGEDDEYAELDGEDEDDGETSREMRMRSKRRNEGSASMAGVGKGEGEDDDDEFEDDEEGSMLGSAASDSDLDDDQDHDHNGHHSGGPGSASSETARGSGSYETLHAPSAGTTLYPGLLSKPSPITTTTSDVVDGGEEGHFRVASPEGLDDEHDEREGEEDDSLAALMEAKAEHVCSLQTRERRQQHF